MQQVNLLEFGKFAFGFRASLAAYSLSQRLRIYYMPPWNWAPKDHPHNGYGTKFHYEDDDDDDYCACYDNKLLLHGTEPLVSKLAGGQGIIVLIVRIVLEILIKIIRIILIRLTAPIILVIIIVRII